MKKIKEVFDLETIALVLVVLLLLCLLFLTRSIVENRANEYKAVPEVVTNFLTEFVPERTLHAQQSVVVKYFASASSTDVDSDGACDTTRNLLRVFRLNSGEPQSYRVCVSQHNYIEIMLVDADGHDLPCRIGMLYRLSGSGKIDSFTAFRLLPVDATDPEWTRVWV